MAIEVIHSADKQRLELRLPNPQRGRVKVLMSVYVAGGLLFILAMLLILYEILSKPEPSYFGAAAMIVLAILGMGYTRNYLKAISAHEIIFIDEEKLVLIKKNMLGSKSTTYELGRISDFRVMGTAQPYIPHDISTPSIDYAGTNMRIKEAAAISSDDRLSFFYEGRNITFGNNLLVSEGEEVMVLITDFSGRALQVDEEMANWQGLLKN